MRVRTHIGRAQLRCATVVDGICTFILTHGILQSAARKDITALVLDTHTHLPRQIHKAGAARRTLASSLGKEWCASLMRHAGQHRSSLQMASRQAREYRRHIYMRTNVDRHYPRHGLHWTSLARVAAERTLEVVLIGKLA